MLKKLATAIAAFALVGTVGVAPPASATDYTITATAKSANIVVKKQLTITGTVLPGKGRVVKTRKAIVQQYRGGKWRTLKKAQIWADGSYRAKVRFKTKGVKTLRVKKSATSESPAVTTDAFQVTVVKRGTPLVYPGPTATSPTPSPAPAPAPPPPPAMAWKPLGEMTIVERVGTGWGTLSESAGQWTNGVFTPQTLQSNVSRHADVGHTVASDWALNRRCETFTARVGVDDDSHSETLSRVQVLLDGVVAFTQDMRLGESVDLTLPVSNVLRLRLQTIKMSDPYADQYVNFGGAQVYCLT